MADIVHIGSGSEPPSNEPDAHGQAALMLAESILHALVVNGTMTTQGALAVVESAQELKEEYGRDSHEKAATIKRSVDLLERISSSLGSDLL